MSNELYPITLNIPFKPTIIQVYGEEGKMWSWMTNVKDRWEQEVDKLKNKSPECAAMINLLKSFGATDEEIIFQIRDWEISE